MHKCQNCDSTHTFVDKNGRAYWKKYDGLILCVKCYSSKRYHANPQKHMGYVNKWIQRNNLKWKNIQEKYQLTHQEKIKGYYVKKKEKNPNFQNEKRRERKLKILNHYSKGTLVCACCQESEINFLSLDHINGKRELGHDRTYAGSKLYEWIIKNDFPNGFQVLCFNCNFAKGHFGKCPHEEIREWK